MGWQLGWDLLSILSQADLKRIDEEHIKKYHPDENKK